MFDPNDPDREAYDATDYAAYFAPRVTEIGYVDALAYSTRWPDTRIDQPLDRAIVLVVNDQIDDARRVELDALRARITERTRVLTASIDAGIAAFVTPAPPPAPANPYASIFASLPSSLPEPE